VYSQATQGLISGRIVDSQSGAAVRGASLAYSSAATSTSGTVQSDAAGYYFVPLLPPGQYRLRVTAEDYQAQEVYELEVPVAGRVDLDFRVRPLNDVWEAGQFRSVFLPGSKAVVTFYGPDVDTSRSAFVDAPRGRRGALETTLSQVIDPAQIRDLPLAGRDVYTVLVTQPGATADSATSRGLGLSVNGQRPSASNFLLDGVENNNHLVTGPATPIAPEAVQEYRISTANYTAEYGRTSGFIANAVTRSGSNDWHGIVYTYLKNDALNANTFQQNAAAFSRLPSKELQPGYQAGGRVLRDRLFISSAFEKFRSRGRGNPVPYTVPSRTLLEFTAPSSIARRLLEQFPGPLVDDPRRLTGEVWLSTPASVDRWLALERIDGLLGGGAHRVFGRVAIARLERPDFIWYPYGDFSSPLRQDTANIALGVQSSLGPRLTNEFRAARGDDRLQWDRAHPEIPTLTSGDGALLPGSPALYAYRNRTRSYEFLDNLTWIRGRHIFKAGGSVLFRKIDGWQTVGRDGFYFFESVFDFALDRPALFSGAVSRLRLPGLQAPQFDREYRNRQFAFFGQDTFRVSRRLAIDFGGRYEYYGAPRNTGAVPDVTLALGAGSDFRERLATSRLTQADRELYRADARSWAGRFGFSYALSGSSVARGSYGLFYDRPFDNLWQNVRNNDVVLPAFPVIAPPLNYLDASLAPYGNQPVDTSFPLVTLLDGGLRNPYSHSYFLGIQQRVGESWSVEANTLGSFGRRLITTDVVNRRADNPELPYVSYRANQGFSSYAALAAAVRYRGLRNQFHLAYTWSHTIDNQSEPLAGDFFDLSFSRVTFGSGRPVLAAFTREFDSSADRGNSDFDQRHNLVFYSIWNLPGRWLRNWKFAQLAAFRTGFPYTVFASSGAGPAGEVFLNPRADLVDAARAETDRPVAGGRQLLNASAFADPPGTRRGNLGRNAFRGPGLFNVDLSLGRTFSMPPLGEGGRVTIRADVFNFLNHANLNHPDPFIDSPTFGVALYGRSGRNPGFPALVPFSETARQVQLLLRLEF
jgi:hypothetical protein